MSQPAFLSKVANAAHKTAIVGLVGTAFYGITVVKSQFSDLRDIANGNTTTRTETLDTRTSAEPK